MFAICSLVVFATGGLLLRCALEMTLQEQLRQELTVRAGLLESMVHKTTTASEWSRVTQKLDAMSVEKTGTQVWVVGENAAFQYGRLPSALAPLKEGFGTLYLDTHECELITLVRAVPASGDRPAVHLVLAKDPLLFWQSLHSFSLALIGVVLAGIAVASLCGFWIARFALAPLGRLSRQAQALTPHKPEQRLGVEGVPTELHDLTNSFNGALERVERAYKQLEGFNADVAHELRTPLTNLIGQTQVVLQRPRSTVELEEILHSNLEELERFRVIVNDMLFLARADQGAMARAQEQVSLAEEVMKVAEFLEPLIEEAGVSFRVEGDAVQRIESSLFCRAVTNLIQNALQHSARGDEIVARIEHRDGHAYVLVSNPGAPIEASHLSRLFDRFYRVDASRCNSVENHGLGLAIVRAIATMHRGTVLARSEQGWNTFGFSVAAT